VNESSEIDPCVIHEDDTSIFAQMIRQQREINANIAVEMGKSVDIPLESLISTARKEREENSEICSLPLSDAMINPMLTVESPLRRKVVRTFMERLEEAEKKVYAEEEINPLAWRGTPIKLEKIRVYDIDVCEDDVEEPRTVSNDSECFIYSNERELTQNDEVLDGFDTEESGSVPRGAPQRKSIEGLFSSEYGTSLLQSSSSRC
jgi:hypothetical protein